VDLKGSSLFYNGNEFSPLVPGKVSFFCKKYSSCLFDIIEHNIAYSHQYIRGTQVGGLDEQPSC